MKKALPILFLILAAVVFLSSCSTTIAITTLAPATVDISGYKTIAVMTTADNTRWTYPSFWNSYIPTRSVDPTYLPRLMFMSNLDFNASNIIRDAATKMIYNSVNNGYMKVLSPEITDGLVALGRSNNNIRGTLLNNGVDAILQTEISSLYYDEYIVQEKNNYKSTYNSESYYEINFYLVQKYAITINYVLTDVENNTIIATRTFASDMKENRTRLGYTRGTAGLFVPVSYLRIPKASELISDLIRTFADSFRKELSPHSEVNYFTFLPNKPKLDSLNKAYDALDDERWGLALELFAADYAKRGVFNSGYNAAILYFATGEREKALALCRELFMKFGDSDALALERQLKDIMAKSDQAKAQINSTEKSGAKNTGDLIGF
jgi:hypothetical protein